MAINKQKYNQAQVVGIIYDYLVRGVTGKEICVRYLGIPGSKITSPRTAYTRFQDVYKNFGFKKKYGGKPWQGMSRGKLENFIADYWSRGFATEEDMLEYFPELRGPLDQAKREEGEAPTHKRSSSSGIKKPSNPRNRYYEEDEYEEEFEEEEDEEEENVRRNYVAPSFSINTSNVYQQQMKASTSNRQTQVKKPQQNNTIRIQHAQPRDIDIDSTRERLQSQRGYNRSRSNSTNNTYKRRDLFTVGGSRGDEQFSSNNYWDVDESLYDKDGAGAIGVFLLVVAAAFVLWKLGVFRVAFSLTGGFLSTIVGVLEILFFYGGILIAIISLLRRRLSATWVSCLSLVIIGLGFGTMRDGHILRGIIIVFVFLFVAAWGSDMQSRR